MLLCMHAALCMASVTLRRLRQLQFMQGGMVSMSTDAVHGMQTKELPALLCAHTSTTHPEVRWTRAPAADRRVQLHRRSHLYDQDHPASKGHLCSLQCRCRRRRSQSTWTLPVPVSTARCHCMQDLSTMQACCCYSIKMLNLMTSASACVRLCATGTVW